MKLPIGGYFGLSLGAAASELPAGIALQSGRACLNYAIQALGIRHLHLPLYNCPEVFDFLDSIAVSYSTYHIDELFCPQGLTALGQYDAILYINYFGLCTDVVARLQREQPSRLIVDNCQSFYSHIGKPAYISFNSARKFYGVPDGGFLFIPDDQAVTCWPVVGESVGMRYDHLMMRLNDEVAEGFTAYQKAEAASSGEVRYMAAGSRKILKAMNFEHDIGVRAKNFLALHESLGHLNSLTPFLGRFIASASTLMPMVYPFLPKCPVDRSGLYSRQVFFPQLWGGLLQEPWLSELTEFERRLCEDLLPLPIDQRYGRDEMAYMVSCLERELHRDV